MAERVSFADIQNRQLLERFDTAELPVSKQKTLRIKPDVALTQPVETLHLATRDSNITRNILSVAQEMLGIISRHPRRSSAIPKPIHI